MTNTTLQLLKSEKFGEVQADIYSNNTNMLMTASQLGECLGYSNPTIAINKLATRNEYLKSTEFSVVTKLVSTDGKAYETRLFNEDGIYEVTFLSKTEKARKFRAWVRGILKSLRKGDIQLSSGDVSIVPEVLVNKIDQLIGYNKQSIQHLQSQQENIIDCLSKQADLLLDLEDEVEKLKNPTSCKQVEVKTTLEIDKKDLIRSIIKPLGQKLHDCSLGYKSTYKKVYVAMNINWKYRITRWNNSHKDNKVKGKFDLLAVDSKLLELFQDAVEKMLQN